MRAEPLLSWARWYDKIFEGLLGGLRSAVAVVVPPEKGKIVLDIGCGTGSQLAIYHAAGCRVFGLDLSEPMLQVARSKMGEGSGFTLGDAMRTPIPDRTFDLVISSLFFHQLDPRQRAAMVDEAVRILKQDGQLLLVDFHVLERRSIIGKLTYLFISIIEFFAGWEHFSNSRDFLANGGVPSLTEGAGLRIRKSVVVGNGNLGIYLLQHVE